MPDKNGETVEEKTAAAMEVKVLDDGDLDGIAGGSIRWNAAGKHLGALRPRQPTH